MRHLLLVDDDADDREFFLSVIEEIDSAIMCATAENGSKALQYLVEGNRKPDAIFLDLNMPVMNGKQFLVEVKKNDELSDIPVIILSTSSDQAIVHETSRLGAAHFITKPNKLSLLEERLKEVLSDPSFFRKP